MNARKDGFVFRPAPLDQRQMGFLAERILVCNQLEISVQRGQIHFHRPPYETFRPHPVRNEVLDRNNAEAEPVRHFHQVGRTRHHAFFGHDFHQRAHRGAAGHAGQVHRRFGMPGPPQHAAVLGAKGKYVARTRKIRGRALRIGERAKGPGAIRRRNARRDAVFTIDGYRKGRVVERSVGVDHHVQVEGRRPLPGKRRANEPPPVRRHEVDGFGGNLVRRAYEIPLVFAVFVVRHDNEPSRRQLPNSVFDRVEIALHPVRVRYLSHDALCCRPARNPVRLRRKTSRKPPAPFCVETITPWYPACVTALRLRSRSFRCAT